MTVMHVLALYSMTIALVWTYLTTCACYNNSKIFMYIATHDVWYEYIRIITDQTSQNLNTLCMFTHRNMQTFVIFCKGTLVCKIHT